MEKQIQTFGEFKSELLSNSNLQDQFKQDPVAAIQQFQQQSPLATDKWIYRIVVLALGCTIVLVILGTIILYLSKVVSSDQGVPTILTAIGSAAIGALAGLLAPPPKGS